MKSIIHSSDKLMTFLLWTLTEIVEQNNLSKLRGVTMYLSLIKYRNITLLYCFNSCQLRQRETWDNILRGEVLYWPPYCHLWKITVFKQVSWEQKKSILKWHSQNLITVWHLCKIWLGGLWFVMEYFCKSYLIEYLLHYTFWLHCFCAWFIVD